MVKFTTGLILLWRGADGNTSQACVYPDLFKETQLPYS